MKASMKALAAAPLAALLLLAACTTPEERAAAAQARLEADKAECEKLGFTPETEAFSNCLLKLKEIRAEEATAAEIRRYNNPPWPWYGPLSGPWPYYGPYPHRYYNRY